MRIMVQEVSFFGLRPPVVAYVKLMLDEWLCIRDIKVVRREDKSLFVSMPNKIGKDGAWHDVVFPVNEAGRAHLESVVLAAVKAKQ